MNRKERGFTLIEFAVVVVIVAILVTVIVFAVSGIDASNDHRTQPKRPSLPETHVTVITDWTDSGGNRSEREIEVNGRRCIESIGYTNYGSGLSCDWSAK